MFSVLIMDNRPLIRIGLRQVVDGIHGYRVVAESATTSRAMDFIQANRPQLAILGTDLGGQTFSLARRLVDEFPQLKIVFFGDADEDEARLSSKAGARGLIGKSTEPEDIERLLINVAGGGLSFPKIEASSVTRSSRFPAVHPLSPREVDVLCCVAHAQTAKEIAKDLKISVKTVDRHKANIMQKLSLKSQIELVRYAIRKGFVDA